MYGDRIATLREEAHLTQQELADEIGIKRSALSHYEKSRREPTYDVLQNIANFFHVTTDYLLEKTDVPLVNSPSTDTVKNNATISQQAIHKKLNKLSTKNLNLVMQIIDALSITKK